MKNRLIFALCMILLFVAFSATADAAEIRISAAASLTDAMKEIVVGYQQKHPEVQLLPNFASSGALAKQIGAGAPADIYISANPKWMQHLQQQGLIAESSERVLVQNHLVFVSSEAAIEKMEDLPSLQRIVLCSPKASPAGRYAEQAMINAGIYEALQSQKKLIFAKDVRQALLYADRGEVDGAFVYRTDALLAQQAKKLFVVPSESYPQVFYPAALTLAGSGNSAAREFINYLNGAAAQDVFEAYGFVIPE